MAVSSLLAARKSADEFRHMYVPAPPPAHHALMALTIVVLPTSCGDSTLMLRTRKKSSDRSSGPPNGVTLVLPSASTGVPWQPLQVVVFQPITNASVCAPASVAKSALAASSAAPANQRHRFLID